VRGKLLLSSCSTGGRCASLGDEGDVSGGRARDATASCPLTGLCRPHLTHHASAESSHVDETLSALTQPLYVSLGHATAKRVACNETDAGPSQRRGKVCVGQDVAPRVLSQ